ncbi:MAG: aryl-sulfate sulfotransferase [Bacteroidales bacterium]|nr:aryl-sulfate sulfotransferase [Bacteroidales bacterium]MCF8376799.1 aryl-sulfate sulfotransferase [Bacteroidales bacterium]MCF8401967.1 aryl-sulfate sulfotransferase [Bacteroidales bacterium]
MKTLITSLKTILFISILLLSITIVAQQTEVIYTSPKNGAEFVKPEQTICIRLNYLLDGRYLYDAEIKLRGSESGKIPYDMQIAEDSKNTLFIKAERGFLHGENVTLEITGLVSSTGIASPIRLKFRIAEQDNQKLLQEFYQLQEQEVETKQIISSDHQTEGFQYPDNNLPPDYPAPIIVQGVPTDDMYIFFTPTPRNFSYKLYLTIWDKYGTPVFYKKMNGKTMNFYRLPNGKLTYGSTSNNSVAAQKYYIMNNSFELIDSITMGNGYDIDLHDMLLLNNGHYLTMAYDPRIVDMSEIVPGGDPEAIVTGLVIQEVDNQENVYFQWRSWDHFEITDATADVNLTGHRIDYCHGNAFDIDHDGNVLLSSRNMDEVTKIDFQTGEIIWRLGKLAKNNEFTFIGDPMGFSHQHDIRVLPNGNYTVYDNGNLHNFPQVSRSVEYQVDENNMIATQVWSYRHNPDIYAEATGGTQRLQSGNTMICWGLTEPIVATEVDHEGNTALEIKLPDDVYGYRSPKYSWETNLFSAPANLNFGDYSGNTGMLIKFISIKNNSSHNISITSTFNHDDAFEVITELPLDFYPGQTRIMNIGFEPDEQGYFNDVLTLNHDNANNSMRIARQVKLSGFWDETLPSAHLTPDSSSINIKLDTVVVSFFDEPVRKAGGGEISIADIPELFIFRKDNLNGEDVNFTGNINGNKTEIRIFPAGLLESNQLYFVELKANKIEDRAGNIINEPVITTFTTANFTGEESIYTEKLPTVWPVPFKNRLFIGGNFSTFSMYNTSGSLIIKTKNTGKTEWINTSALEKGIYLISFEIEAGKHTFKILKK